MNNDPAEVSAVAAATPSVQLQPQQISLDVLQEKYMEGATSPEQVFERAATAVAAVEKTEEARAFWAGEFKKNMIAGAIGAGRIMASAGVGNNSTWINCFVQPVADCTIGYDEEQRPGIYTALAEAGETLRRGGGVGFNFSLIRPKGALVKGTSSDASGPCAFIDIYDTSCKTVMAAGDRRGAQMGILGVDHPDVVEFIRAKRTKGRWKNFNVSVGVSDEFMDALMADADWQLVHKAEPTEALRARGVFQRDDGLWVYETVKATELWDTIMRSTYEFSEPGVVFLGRVAKDNNLWYCEVISGTNPCGEQPLPPYGCCDLGPIILPKLVRDPFTDRASFDMDRLIQLVKVQVRLLDNVLDGTPWPLEKQRAEAMAKRRIGVGFTGLGNALAMLGLRYDRKEGRDMAAEIGRQMRDAAYTASVDLAIERGAFPLFDAEKYLKAGTFASRLPEEIKERIRKHGIRNSHLLSIAPTGTVSLAFADNASNGIEPPFSLVYTRKKRQPDDTWKEYTVVDHGFRVFLATLQPSEAQALFSDAVAYKEISDRLPPAMITALKMTAEEHVAMLGAVQPFIDSAISKTVNVPEDYSFEDFKGVYMSAYKQGLKGVATHRPNSVTEALLVAGPAPAVAADLDPLRVTFDRRPEGELPSVSEKVTYWTSEGKRSLYLVVSFAKVDGIIGGQPVSIERPIEVFMPASQSGDGQQWLTATMRTLSLAARAGQLPKALADLRKVSWDKGPVRCGFYTKADGTQVPRFHGSEVAAIAYTIQQILVRRGYLDSEGNVVPAAKQAAAVVDSAVQPVLAAAASSVSAAGYSASAVPSMASSVPMNGKECPECGAHAVVRRDGCETCSHCHWIGSCG